MGRVLGSPSPIFKISSVIVSIALSNMTMSDTAEVTILL
jgi:hypothetical protein